VLRNALRFLLPTVPGTLASPSSARFPVLGSAKADQNPYPRVLGVPVFWNMCQERRAKPNCRETIQTMNQLCWISNQNVPESRGIGTKRNLAPHLRAPQSARASSAAFALSANLAKRSHERSE
jgi:hypothetical protein